MLLNKVMGAWRGDARRADESIKHCKKCNKCWEMVSYCAGTSGQRKKWIAQYYNNFVSYGKSKKTCPRCIAQQNNNCL